MSDLRAILIVVLTLVLLGAASVPFGLAFGWLAVIPAVTHLATVVFVVWLGAYAWAFFKLYDWLHRHLPGGPWY